MIRQATAADAATILAMLWEARDQIGLSQYLNFDSDGYRKWMRGLCAEKQVRVFDRDGAITGAVVIGAIPRDTVIERETEIAYVVTAPAHRRSGVAAALVEDAKARLWNRYGVARACTDPDNASAIRLLEKHGFVFDRTDDVGWRWFTATRPV